MAEVKKIMVAVDDSEFSHYALQWALSNLHLYGSDVSLVVFHAQPLAVFNSAATMGVTLAFEYLASAETMVDLCNKSNIDDSIIFRIALPTNDDALGKGKTVPPNALPQLYRKMDKDPEMFLFQFEIVFRGHDYVKAPELIETLVNQQRQVSEAILARAKEMCAQKNVIVETVSEIGDPKDAICDAIEKLQIDLLIIGSHGYGMLKRAFLGSVSNYCVHYAKCPVLVTKKPS